MPEDEIEETNDPGDLVGFWRTGKTVLALVISMDPEGDHILLLDDGTLLKRYGYQ